ncbi:MAG: AAA family ATPase [Caldilineaceae bacterium SB0668_bin_21]|nr:AAA family ATPase [Caldilineaceae bacterium SB0668_bin_21]MYC23340.1 AAA family ATPase [Caldilineaceae bacterium SB0662_bin_25]
MRNPYTVGRWLRGDDHYGRQQLLNYLISAEDPAIWVVGTRRMGKTSLLRQLEWLLTQQEGASAVPLFWDLQGSETKDDFDYELFLAVEDEMPRFEAYGVDVSALYNRDAIHILRTLQRGLRAHGKHLLLLIDEAEAWISLAKNDYQALARLRKAFQSGGMRTIMTSTKLLMQLNDLTRNWLTSPFLFGFSLVHLWSLEPEASVSLVLQEQSNTPVNVERERINEILRHSHRHPYLVQTLCYRLFEERHGRGALREIREEDLRADHLLAGFFEVDFRCLAPTERQILLTVARQGVISEEELVAKNDNESIDQISMYVHGMNNLGYLQRAYSRSDGATAMSSHDEFPRWTIGNEFLRRWMLENYQELAQTLYSDVSDYGVETLLEMGRKVELDYLQHEIPELQGRLESLLAAYSGHADQTPPQILQEIQELRRELEKASGQLRNLAD